MTTSRLNHSIRVGVAAFGLALIGPGLVNGQAVEVISGGQSRVDRGPGIRVTARVSEDLGAPRYEAALPLSYSEVLIVQRALDRRGYDPGPLDGVLGSQVETAIDEYRSDLGLAPCGCLDGPTLASLGIRARVIQTFVGTTPGDPPIEIIRPRRRIGSATGGRVIEVIEDMDQPAATETHGTEPVLLIPVHRGARKGAGAANTSPARGGRRIGTGAGRLQRGAPPPRPPLR